MQTREKLMKKIILMCLFGLMFGQTIDGLHPKDLPSQYIEIIGAGGIYKKEVKITIDYGQGAHNPYKKWSKVKIKSDKGREIVFISMVDALNFLTKNGYKHIDSYTLVADGLPLRYYLLKKK